MLAYKGQTVLETEAEEEEDTVAEFDGIGKWDEAEAELFYSTVFSAV